MTPAHLPLRFAVEALVADNLVDVLDPGRGMNITTSPKIWANRNFLTVVHQANEIIERETGPKSESLAVYWALTALESPPAAKSRFTAATKERLTKAQAEMSRYEAPSTNSIRTSARRIT